MNRQQQLDFNRITQAIQYISTNYKKQPSLNEIAEQVHLSPFHFQRLFSQWAGTTPKKFLQYISISHAKRILGDPQTSLFDTAYDIGLSGTSRLHDLFVNIEGMTPLEYKNGGKLLQINYNFHQSHFGDVLIAATSKGICYITFSAVESESFKALKLKFPKASFERATDTHQLNALGFFQNDWEQLELVKLHLKATDFQLKVWEALLKIPMGKLSTYGSIAQQLGNPNASRAVGTAIGSNPVAFLIPCHRVIQSTGAIGGYRWGSTRKTALIGWEQAQSIG